jgi:hypothetical protein
VITDNTYSMIRDLVKKYPKGPQGKYTKKDYATVSCYSTPHGRYRLTATLWWKHPSEKMEAAAKDLQFLCGYSPEDVFPLRELDALNLILEAFDGIETLTKPAATRRKNLLRQKIEIAESYTQKKGIPGVYSVSWGWDANNRLFIYGINNVDVEATAVVMCGSLGHDMSETPRIRYYQPGLPATALKLNRESLKRNIQRHENSVSRYQDQLDRAKQDLNEYMLEANILESIFELQKEISNA